MSERKESLSVRVVREATCVAIYAVALVGWCFALLVGDPAAKEEHEREEARRGDY